MYVAKNKRDLSYSGVVCFNVCAWFHLTAENMGGKSDKGGGGGGPPISFNK